MTTNDNTKHGRTAAEVAKVLNFDPGTKQTGPEGRDDTERDDVTAALNDERVRRRIHRGLGILSLPRPDWLIDEVIHDTALFLLVGPPKNGKSFAALDLAACVATGRPWMGKQTRERRNVVYVAGEGWTGLGQRLEAWHQHHAQGDDVDLDGLDDIYWHHGPIQLTERTHVDALVRYCVEVNAGVIIFDTLARSIVGVEENSAKEMGRVIDNLEVIRNDTGAAVGAVHHTGKNAEAGPRGTSALLGAVDTQLQCVKTDGLITLTVKDQKDGPEGYTMKYRLVPVASSVVLDPLEPVAVTPWDGPTNCMAAVLEVLTDAGPSVSYSQQKLIKTMRTLGHTFRNVTVIEAVDRLTLDGRVVVSAGPRGARQYAVAPPTAALDLAVEF